MNLFYLSWIIYAIIISVLLHETWEQRITHESQAMQITPMNPVVEAGTDLELNCTLIPCDNGAECFTMYTAEDIRVNIENVVYSKMVLNSCTMKVTLENVTRAVSGKHIFCFIPDDGKLNETQITTVGDKPRKPVISECRGFNWQSMTCRWEPMTDVGIPTDQTLYWTLYMSDDPWQTTWNYCPNPEDNSCTWYVIPKARLMDMDFLRLHLDYFIVVLANNSLGYSSSITYDMYDNVNAYRPTHLVEPAAVAEIILKQKRSRELVISWSRPPDLPYKYGIT